MLELQRQRMEQNVEDQVGQAVRSGVCSTMGGGWNPLCKRMSVQMVTDSSVSLCNRGGSCKSEAVCSKCGDWHKMSLSVIEFLPY